MIDPASSEAEVLRKRAADLISAGELPKVRPRTVKVGRGLIADCSVCAQRIAEGELRYHIDSNGGPALHVDCYLVYETVSDRASA